jgi:5-aminolevulinate synthase
MRFRSYAPGSIFITSLAPAIVAGVLASIKHLNETTSARLGKWPRWLG